MEFKCGQVLLFEKNGPFDLFGTLIADEEGDTNYTHAAIVDGTDPTMLWTTGARKRLTWKPPFVEFVYGQVKADEYCKGRTFAVAEVVEPLLPFDLLTMQQVHHHFDGMSYGLGKVLRLVAESTKGKFVPTQSSPPITSPWNIINPFCSEAVSACLWVVGKRVCAELGKLSPDAITPENLAVAARYSRVLKMAGNQPGGIP